MIVTTTLDVKAFSLYMTDVERRQLPYAVMLALNYTAEDVQEAVRNRIRRRGFTIRSAVSDQWLTNQVYFGRGNRATKTRLIAQVDVGRKVGARAGLLAMLEEGFLRRSNRIVGSDKVFPVGSIAIPNRGRSPLTQIDRSLYPSMLGIQERMGPDGFQKVWVGKGKRRKQQFAGLKGRRRTFVVRTGPGTGQVRQRIGSDKRATILLFRIRPPKPVGGRHFFFSTAQETAEKRFLVNLRKGFAEAMATAR